MKPSHLLLSALSAAVVTSCSMSSTHTLTVANPVPGVPPEKNINIMAQRLDDCDINVKEIAVSGDSVTLTILTDASDSLVKAILEPVGRLNFVRVAPIEESHLDDYTRAAIEHNPGVKDKFMKLTDFSNGFAYFSADGFDLPLVDSLLRAEADSVLSSTDLSLHWTKRLQSFRGDACALCILDNSSSMRNVHVAKAEVEYDDRSGYQCTLTFTPDDGKEFARLTGSNVGQTIATIIDDEIVMAPIVHEVIDGGRAQITGYFTEEELKTLASVIKNPYVR